jgi:hypothetical protein
LTPADQPGSPVNPTTDEYALYEHTAGYAEGKRDAIDGRDMDPARSEGGVWRPDYFSGYEVGADEALRQYLRERSE